MVSWGFAFKKGFIIFLWTILWGFLGGIIAIAVSGGALIAAIAAGTYEAVLGAFAGILGGTILGMLIASIGTYASIVKVVMESTLEASEKTATRLCTQCGRKVPLDMKYCPHCGKTFA